MSANHGDALPIIPGIPESERDAIQDVNGQSDALAENIQLTSGRSIDDLAQEARSNEHGRNEKFRDHFEKIAIASLYVLFGYLFFAGTVWLLHIILSPKCRWLSPEEVAHLQSILSAGIVIGVVGNHYKKRLD